MPLTTKGRKIMGAMKDRYGEDKGESVFYASENKGTIEGVHKSSGSAKQPRASKKLDLTTLRARR